MSYPQVLVGTDGFADVFNLQFHDWLFVGYIPPNRLGRSNVPMIVSRLVSDGQRHVVCNHIHVN